ncbi:Eco57I restriction-modification methylase domain-containing protein [Streptococcus pneumoniae]
MKFDVVVGNPPYQENDNGKREDGSANASASPLYDKFFYFARKHSNRYVNLIFPARWLTGAGKGLGNFAKDMLNDSHFSAVTIHQDSSQVFQNTDIKGGVMNFTYDKEHHQAANITVIEKTREIHQFSNYLNSANSGIFIPFKELINIFTKVKEKEDLESRNIQKIVSVLKPYGLRTDFLRNPSKYKLPPIFAERSKSNDIEIFGLLNTNRVSRFVPRDYPIPTGLDTIETWKVFAPYAYGSGTFGEVGATLLLGKPLQISTETFLRIGSFKTEFEAQALINYYKTKFFRALIGILKVTQHSTTTYGFVPLQDFTPNSDIDWSKSIAEIDQQLYRKYGLNEQEIAFIEEKVKEME